MLWWAHSLLRFVVLAVGVAVIGWAAYGAATNKPFEKPMRALGAAYAGLLDANIVVGLFLLVSDRYFQAGLIGHIFLMVFAAVVAHIPNSVMKRRDPAERSHLPYVITTLVSLILMAVAILALGRPIFGVTR